MTIKRTLTYLVAGGLALIGSSCSDNNSEYAFFGKIGEDQLDFYRVNYVFFGGANVLTIKKPNGVSIKYVDNFKDDLKLDYITIIKPDKEMERYDGDDEIGGVILNEGQKNFEGYLRQIKEAKNKIKEIKLKKALEDLK